MDPLWLGFQSGLSSEVGMDLAADFVKQLYDLTGGDVFRTGELYFQAGKRWGPLISAWRNWIGEKAKHEPIIMMRDAKPLTALPGMTWRRAWLNRKLCGIVDELASDDPNGMNPDVTIYLDQMSLHQPFTFVDSGCWGTLVKELYCRGYQFQTLFFFSHNPHIPGFLNECGIDMQTGERLNDSLECAFPNEIKRPSRFHRLQGLLQPVCDPMDPFSQIFGRAALRGIAEGSYSVISMSEVREFLVTMTEEARQGLFTGFLPRNSPTWSHGHEFLSAWPHDLSWV